MEQLQIKRLGERACRVYS